MLARLVRSAATGKETHLRTGGCGHVEHLSWSVLFNGRAHPGMPPQVSVARWIWRVLDRSHNDIYCRMSVACDESAPTGRSTNHSDELAVGSVATFSCRRGHSAGHCSPHVPGDLAAGPQIRRSVLPHGLLEQLSAEQGSARGTGVGQVMWEIGSNHVTPSTPAETRASGWAPRTSTFLHEHAWGLPLHSQEQGQSRLSRPADGRSELTGSFARQTLCPTTVLRTDGWGTRVPTAVALLACRGRNGCRVYRPSAGGKCRDALVRHWGVAWR